MTRLRHGRHRPVSTVLVWVLGIPFALLIGEEILLALATGDTSTGTIVAPFSAITSLAVGAVLVTRLPHHRIGWLLWITGLFIATTRVAGGLADHGLTSSPGSIPGAIWFAWLNAWTGILGVFSIPIFLPLFYPTGHPLTPRWRPVALGALLVLVAYSIVAALSPFTGDAYPATVSNPLALTGAGAEFLVLAKDVLGLLLFLALALGFVSLVLRYRRSFGVERQQLKWFAFAGAIAIAALLIAGLALGATEGPLSVLDSIAWFVGIGGLALMPVAIGLAVLRYRLYEIDRLISRTIGWGMVTVILGAVFVGLVLGLQTLVAPLTRSNELAVAGSTLLVAALFQPLRRRVQGLVDRRFNRSRYDAQQAVDTFSARLRDEVDLETLQEALMTIVDATLEPTTVSLWLRE